MGPERRKLRSVLTVDAVQPRLLFRLLLCWLVAVVLLVALAVLPPALCGLLGGVPEFGWLETQLRLGVLGSLVALPLLGGLTLFFAFALHETFRFAGPCFRFRTVFHDLSELRVPAGVKIRDDDYLQDLAQDLDHGLGRIQAQLHESHELSTRVQELIRRAERDGESSPDLALVAEQLHHALSQFDLLPAGLRQSPETESALDVDATAPPEGASRSLLALVGAGRRDPDTPGGEPGGGKHG